MNTETEIYLAGNHIMVKAGYSDPAMHRHSAAHLIVSSGGNFTLETEDSRISAKGVLIPSGCPHTVRNEGNALLVFMFDSTTTVAEDIKSVSVIEDETAEKIAELYLAGTQVDPAGKAEWYRGFIGEVISLFGAGRMQTRISDERIAGCIHYVEEHIEDDLTEEDVAGSAYLSVSRFSHLFKEQTGISFAGYLILRRMYKAYTLLASGMSITEAATMAGFSSPSHFAAVNKKIFGINAGAVGGNLKVYPIESV